MEHEQIELGKTMPKVHQKMNELTSKLGHISIKIQLAPPRGSTATKSAASAPVDVETQRQYTAAMDAARDESATPVVRAAMAIKAACVAKENRADAYVALEYAARTCIPAHEMAQSEAYWDHHQ